MSPRRARFSEFSLTAAMGSFPRPFANSCQRKVEMSGFVQDRNVRFHGFLQGCSAGTWYLGLLLLFGFSLLFASPAGRRPEGLAGGRSGWGQRRRCRERSRKRNQWLPSSRRSISTAAPRSPAQTSSRTTPQRFPSQLTVWSCATCASTASAVPGATLSIGPVLVGSMRFAPFPWAPRPSMKADISTLHKPDILTLQRHRSQIRCVPTRGGVGCCHKRSSLPSRLGSCR